MQQYNEIWKQIDGYKNYYVSNFGRVKNIETEKILKPWITCTGYLHVSLSLDGKVKKFAIHRLVAIAFVLNLKNRHMVDHIDNERTNNRADNLRWCTNQENCFNFKKKEGSSSYKGVMWDKARKKWTAKIKHNYIGVFLGRFDTEEEAGRAYDAKARELFGEFAKLNFP